MRWRVLVAAIVPLSIACGATTSTPIGSSCPSPAPDYRSEVAPIVERRCGSCHAGDGVAAGEHDFSRFVTLHAQASRAADQVNARAMPPRSSPPLTADERKALLAWIACGASP